MYPLELAQRIGQEMRMIIDNKNDKETTGWEQ